MAALSGEKLTRMISQSREKCSALDNAKLKEIDESLAIAHFEHFKFQSLQAQYHAAGVLSPEAAQIVYVALGEVGHKENGGWSLRADTATKFIVTQLMGELLSMDIKLRQKAKATA